MADHQNKPLQIERVLISSLSADPANVRKHDEKNLQAIMGSLRAFGQQKPIVVDMRGIVLAGNGTLAAAKAIGWDKIDIVRTDLKGTEAIAYAIADNRSGELADWDDELLGVTLASIADDGFDLNSIGFDLDDLNDILPKPEVEGNTDPDDVPEVPQNIHNVQRGDIYQLGDHRLMCGDSTDKADVEKLMNGEKADMVFTDPPYNHAGEEKLVSKSVRQAMQKLSESEWDKNFSFLDVAGSIEILLSENSTVYVCTSQHLAGEIWEWMKKRSNHYSYCVWHKPNPMPSLMKRHWTWSSELICYATFGKHTFNFPSEGHASNVWQVNKNSKNDLHPTMKPIAIPEMAITHSSKNGNIVADLFLGSGSTLIACEKTGRKCFGCEIDPHYCSVIIERWEKFTGKKAVKIDDSKGIAKED